LSSLVRIYLALLIVTTTDGALNTIFSPYLNSLQYPLEQIGIIVALFGVTQLIARLPSGILYGRGKVGPLMTGLLVLYSASMVAFAYPGGTLYLLFWTMAHGFAFGGIGTVLLAWAIDLNPPGASQAATMGWYTAALSGGYSIGYFLGGYIADHWGFPSAFIVAGLLPALSVALVLTLTSARPTEPERSLRAPVPQRSTGPRRTEWLKAISPNLMLATLIAFYLNFLDDGFAAFFPLYGLGVGLNLTFIGLLKSIRSFTATGLRPFSGWIFRYLPMRLLSNVLLVAWAGCVIIVPNLREPWMLVILFAAMGVCRGLTRVSSATMIAEEKARNPHSIGIASGLYNAGLDVGSFIGPMLAGWIAALTGIETMFRIAPLAVLTVYVLAAVAVARYEAAQLPRAEAAS
jgi:MFS family permease